MSQVPVKNPTNRTICVWWGATPYIIAAGDTKVLPDAVVRDCLGHNDYKELIINPDEPEELKTEKTVTLNIEDDEEDNDE